MTASLLFPLVSQSTNATNASQAAAFAMRLQDLLDLFWADVSIVVKGVKTFREGLLALRAEIALMSIGHLAVFMGLSMTTEPTFHCVSNVIVDSLLYQTHIILTHYH